MRCERGAIVTNATKGASASSAGILALLRGSGVVLECELRVCLILRFVLLLEQATRSSLLVQPPVTTQQKREQHNIESTRIHAISTPLRCAACVCFVCVDLMRSLILLPSTMASFGSSLVYARRDGSFTEQHKQQTTTTEGEQREAHEATASALRARSCPRPPVPKSLSRCSAPYTSDKLLPSSLACCC